MATIDDALARLQGSLSLLEAAVARRIEAEDAQGDRETERRLMVEDRNRLAAELDAASARLVTMNAATDEVGRRLERAIDTVEDVLDRAHPAG